jgi:formylglycine-generating enzyme required for sulfatase activity
MSITLELFSSMNFQEKRMFLNETLRTKKKYFLISDLQNESSLLPTLVHRQTGLEFSYVLGGEFDMGLSEEEEMIARKICNPFPANIDEMRPVSRITIQSFLISKLPILNELAAKFINHRYDKKNKFYPAYLDRHHAKYLVQELGGRLPYEREWEYACRAKTKTLFVFGNELPQNKELEKWISWDFSNMKNLLANPFGLYGLFIGEWCEDKYKLNYNESSSTEDNSYVIRGGASNFWPWQDEEWVWCMSAMRMPSTDLLDGTCGLRVVFDI